MTNTEANQYESQGWPHIHDWNFLREPVQGIKVYKCHCGETMLERGDFRHILNTSDAAKIELANKLHELEEDGIKMLNLKRV